MSHENQQQNVSNVVIQESTYGLTIQMYILWEKMKEDKGKVR